MKFKTSIIVKEAAEIKAFIEKYKRIPKTCTIGNTTLSPYSASYLLSKVVNHFDDKECGLADVIIYNAERHKDTINEKVYKDDYLIMIKNFLKFCVDHKRVPAYVTTQKSHTKVSFELYFYCVSKIVKYYKENKVLPNYCLFSYKDLSNANTSSKTSEKSISKSTSTSKKTSTSTTRFVSEPHYTAEGCNKLGQCTPYFCGPHSIHQALRKFGITKFTEKQIAAYAGTTSGGTSHPGINTAIAKISKATGLPLGGGLSKTLAALVESDFITCYSPYGMPKSTICYKLIDNFCLFWLKYVEENSKDAGFISDNMTSDILKAWHGVAFEEVCWQHIQQIKRALEIGGVKSSLSAWNVRGDENQDGTQIDLLIIRNDNVVNLCEMKFASSPYTISKEEEIRLRHRIEALKATLSPKQTIHLTMITTYGIAYGKHSGIVQKEVTMDSLFE